MIENPTGAENIASTDVLASLLHKVRLSGSLQFCFIAAGDWETDTAPSLARMAASQTGVVPFHIVAEGACWLKMEGQDALLEEGDIVAFPFGTGHQLGSGRGGRLVTPMGDLPPKPWRQLPVLHYGDEESRTRLLCGFLQCDAINFRPLRDVLPAMLHIKTRGANNAGWLRSMTRQILDEVDNPRTGSLSMLERLTEITFVELLRHQIVEAGPAARGWLAALGDPALGRCFALIHDDPQHDWSVQELATVTGLSRSALSERFETMLGTSPMRYVREWRLCLASISLATGPKTIAIIALEAGYGTEAAFNRAFSRTYGMPPAAWRQNARRGQVS